MIEVVGESFTGGANAQGRRRYQVHGTTDRAMAYALAMAAAPMVQGGLIRQNVHVEQEGDDVWNADVQYGVMEQGEPGDVSWSFDISTENFHLTNALAHVQSYPANDHASWRIWAKGELLFLGAAGAKRGEEAVGMTYRFASSKSKAGMTIGDIGGVDKEGHHYLWVQYEKQEDAGANKLVPRPLAVHVERVYDYADFAALGLTNDPWN